MTSRARYAARLSRLARFPISQRGWVWIGVFAFCTTVWAQAITMIAKAVR